jgi:hypothetical protein
MLQDAPVAKVSSADAFIKALLPSGVLEGFVKINPSKAEQTLVDQWPGER